MNLFRFWPIFGPFLALLFGVLHSPQGFAARGNPYCDLFVSTQSSPSDKANLAKLGYRVVVSPQLRFSLFSLRAHTDSGAWALERSAKYDRVYFEMPDGLNNVPIMSFTLKAKGLASCAQVQKAIDEMGKRRALVVKALRYLSGDRSVRFLDALIDLEQLEILKRGKTVPVNYHYLNPVRTAAHQAWVNGQKANFFHRLNDVRRAIVDSSLRRYCRDQTTISELSVKGCTNCVGQTALILALYTDLAIDPPAPWQLGFALYDDHMQPVLYDSGRNHILDLLDNKITLNKDRNPVLAPSELLRMALRKHRDMIWDLDKVVIDRVEYLSSEPMLDFFTANRQSEPDITATNAHSRVDAFSFQGIRTRAQYSVMPVPETADLRALVDSGYMIASDVQRGDNDELARLGRTSVSVARGTRQSEPEISNYRRPVDYANYSFSTMAIQSLIPSERKLFEDMIRLNSVSPEMGRRFARHQVHASLQSDAGVSILLPFAIRLEPRLSGIDPFRIIQREKGLILELPTQALVEEFQGLPLVRRYQRLLELGRQFVATHLRQDLEELAGLFESESILGKITNDSPEWPSRIRRIKGGVAGWGIQSLSLWNDVFDLEQLRPQTRRLEAAARSLSEKWGRDHRQFLEATSRLSEDQINLFFLFFARLSTSHVQYLNADVGDSYERMYLWESLTRPLMLGILFDQKYLWTAQRTPEERTQREVLEATFIPVEENSPMELKGPPVELPKLGKCEPGQTGWVGSGNFVWRCPDQAQKRVVARLGTQSVTIALRQPREISAGLLGALLTLNYRMFIHPGHLLLAHEMWNNALDKGHADKVILLLTSGADMARLGQDVASVWSSAWKLAPMLLSERLPVASRNLTAREFLMYSQKKREVPDWIQSHSNYVEAFAHFKAHPRHELASKRDLLFASEKPANGWAATVQNSTGAIQPAYGAFSQLNPSFSLASAPQGKSVEISLEARFGTRMIVAHLIDDGRSITASPTTEASGVTSSLPGGALKSCPITRAVSLADGQVYKDSIERNCPMDYSGGLGEKSSSIRARR